jgi:aspartate 1-decarboxylase
MLKSKIHRATVTGSALHYVGSLTVAPELLAAADILANEQVAVANLNNGERFETYAIPGEVGLGEMRVNGAAARRVHPGDLIIVFSYALYADVEAASHSPRVVHVDKANRLISVGADPTVLLS